MAQQKAFNWESKRILIVDQDDHFRFWARGVFKQQRVRDAISLARCSSAPSVLLHHHIDLAIVDMHTGDAEVGQFLEWLRENKTSPTPKLPVLLLAKAIEPAQLGPLCLHGIHGVLQKPLSAAALLNSAMGVIANPRLFKVAPAAPPPPAALPVRRKAAPPTDDTPANTGAKSATAAMSSLFWQSARTGAAPTTPLPAAGRRKSDGAGHAGPRDGGSGSGGLAVDGGKDPAGASTGAPTGAYVELAELSPAAGFRDAPLVDDRPKAPRRNGSVVIDLRPVVAAKEDGIELVEAPDAKPTAPGGPDVEQILEEHARWAASHGREGRRANLNGADMTGRNLAEAVLTSAVLRHTDLSGCDLGGAQMHGADLREADLTGANLAGANLAVARLRRARLIACQFDGASLKGADLAGADLEGARMGDAELAGAILVGASLAGADFHAVSGLTQGQLEGVRGDSRTRLPPGLFLPAAEDEEG